jgi:hypothetical protein
MKTAHKAFSAALLASFLLAGAVSAADFHEEASASPAEAQDYGQRALRITSSCGDKNAQGNQLPNIPPPASAPDPNCPGVLNLVDSPSGRWSVDISWFDPNTEKYYLADRNNGGVDIIDVKTDEVVGFAGGFIGTRCPTPSTVNCLPAPPANSAGPNGVLTTTNPRQLWAGDGDGTVKVFSLDSDGLPTTMLTPVNAGGKKRADEMAFDPDDHLVLAAWDDDDDLFVAFISVSSTPTVMGKIAIPEAATCGIEQPVYHQLLKRFFIAIPCTSTVNAANQNNVVHANGEIAVINPKTMKIETVLGLDGTNCFPHGLAVGPRQNLLLGCSGDAPAGTQMKSIIMRATDGTILQTFTQLGGSDEVWFNPADNHYYLAMSSWTSTGKTGAGTGGQPGTATPSLGIIDAGTKDTGSGAPAFVQNIPTTRTSHSVAAVFTGNCTTTISATAKGNGKRNTSTTPCHSKVYVPLTTVPTTGTPTEPGGIGIYGQIP